MNVDQSDNEYTESGRFEHRFISKKELESIQVLWATGNNINRIRDGSLYPHFGNYTILCVQMNELIKKVDFLDLDPEILFSGDEFSDSVTNGVINHWVKGGFMDPPTLTICGGDGLRLGDGRHRTIVAYHIGLSTIPVTVHVTMVHHLRKIIGLFEC